MKVTSLGHGARQCPVPPSQSAPNGTHILLRPCSKNRQWFPLPLRKTGFLSLVFKAWLLSSFAASIHSSLPSTHSPIHLPAHPFFHLLFHCHPPSHPSIHLFLQYLLSAYQILDNVVGAGVNLVLQFHNKIISSISVCKSCLLYLPNISKT